MRGGSGGLSYADLDGEMRRVAGFLGIETPEALWSGLVEAAGFEVMRRQGAALLGRMAAAFRDGGTGFIHMSSSGRWRDLFDADDLARYDAALSQLPNECARWLTAGRLGASVWKTSAAASSAVVGAGTRSSAPG